MNNPTEATTPEQKRRRAAPLLWFGSTLAAAMLVLGVNGTLSAWTTAIMTNDQNISGSAAAVALEESGPDSTGQNTTCTTSTTADNTATCSTINKYGANGVTVIDQQADGVAKTTVVTFTNTGAGDAASFEVAAGACSAVFNTGPNSGSAPTGDSLCDHLLVAVSCTGGVTLDIPAVTLTGFETGSSYAFSGGLASGASTTCTFSTTLPTTAPASVGGQTVTQPIVWTLAA